MKKYAKSNIIPYRSFRAHRYPNAADTKYYIDKFLDWVLAAAISLGTVSTLLFFLVLR